MIDTKIKLNSILKLEFNNYFPNKYLFIKAFLLGEKNIKIWRYQKFLRKLEYHKCVQSYNKLYHNWMYLWYSKKVNNLGVKLGIDAWHSIFDEGLIIYHSVGGIIVNSNARIGKNCHLHGNNCIGNNGFNHQAPIIGDNCSLGVGAKIIGNVYIANDITIGAGAVVLKSCHENGAVLIGMPATIKELHKKAGN